MYKRLLSITAAATLVMTACGGSTEDAQPLQTSSPIATTAATDAGDQPAPEAEDRPSTAATTSSFAGVFSVSVDDETYRGEITDCIRDGGTEAIETVFQARGAGETADGEPFNALFGHYLQDLDGDGTKDTQMQLSVEVGRAGLDEPAPTGQVYLAGQFSETARATSGRMEAATNSDGVVTGFGDVTDTSGTLAPQGETLVAAFLFECGE